MGESLNQKIEESNGCDRQPDCLSCNRSFKQQIQQRSSLLRRQRSVYAELCNGNSVLAAAFINGVFHCIEASHVPFDVLLEGQL